MDKRRASRIHDFRAAPPVTITLNGEVRDINGSPTVADLDGEQAGQTIEVAATVVVPDVGTLAAHDDRDVVAVVQAGVAGEVQPQMITSRDRPLGTARGPRATAWLGAAGRDNGRRCHRVPQS